MDKKKLVILSDYGLDDACALIFLLMNKQLFAALDIVAIAGNTSAENSLRNLKKLVAAYEKDIAPLKAMQQTGKSDGFAADYDVDLSNVTIVDTCDLQQEYSHLPSIHGNDGMGDLLPDAEPKVKSVKFDEWLKNLADGYIMFSAGPCTLTKTVQDKAHPSHTVLMAGTVDAEPNYNGMEFNQALDAESYNECVNRKNTVTATLDTCRNAAFNLAGKKIGGNNLLNRLLDKARELAEARHPDNCYVYDYIAAHALTEPQMFATTAKRDRWGNTVMQLAWVGNGSDAKE